MVSAHPAQNRAVREGPEGAGQPQGVGGGHPGHRRQRRLGEPMLLQLMHPGLSASSLRTRSWEKLPGVQPPSLCSQPRGRHSSRLPPELLPPAAAGQAFL